MRARVRVWVTEASTVPAAAPAAAAPAATLPTTVKAPAAVPVPERAPLLPAATASHSSTVVTAMPSAPAGAQAPALAAPSETAWRAPREEDPSRARELENLRLQVKQLLEFKANWQSRQDQLSRDLNATRQREQELK